MNDPTPHARIADLGGLTEIVPYLLGFTPQESMVLMATVAGRVEVTARADLADVQRAGLLEDLCDRLQHRFPTATILTLAYTDRAEVGWHMLRRAEQHLGARGAPTRLLVTGDTWYDAQGRSGTIDRYGPLAAQAAVHGLRRENQRSDLANRFQSPPLTDTMRDIILDALDSLPPNHAIPDQIRLTHQLIDRHAADGGAHLDTADAARLTTLTHLPAAADLAMGLIGHPVDAIQHLALWTTVVNRLPERLTETPLQLAAVAAWVAGEGAISTVALEAADKIQIVPANTPMCTLLDIVNRQVMPPAMWRDIRDEIVSTAHPTVRALLDAQNRPAADQPQAPWETVEPPDHHDPRTDPPQPARPATGPAI